MTFEETVKSSRRIELIPLDSILVKTLSRFGIQDGLCSVYVPHTTAAVMINENADPDVQHDFLEFMNRTVPEETSYYRHSEGNSHAHIKSILVGHSVQIPVRAGKLLLGTWQSIFFCEFDGPRPRKILITF